MCSKNLTSLRVLYPDGLPEIWVEIFGQYCDSMLCVTDTFLSFIVARRLLQEREFLILSRNAEDAVNKWTLNVSTLLPLF